MAHIYAPERKWSQVVDAAQQALPLLKTPGLQARLLNQLGIAYVSLNDLGKAEEVLRRAADLDGEWGGMARYNLAEVLYRRQDWAAAVEAARLYLKGAGPGSAAFKEIRPLLCRARDQLPDGAPPAGANAEPLKIKAGDGVQRPEVLINVKPVYPQQARASGTTGEVIVEAVIDEEGCVRNVRALKAQPDGLTESAMVAIRRWVFSPATLDGKPVKIYYVLNVNFSVGRSGPRPSGSP
jgi:TonB family protein